MHIVSLDFAKMVLLIVRYILSGQRYHRCQLSLVLLKSTCSHLVVMHSRLRCHQAASISSTVNIYDYITAHFPCQVLTAFSNSPLNVGSGEMGTSQENRSFAEFVVNHSSGCHWSWMCTPMIDQFSWWLRHIFRCLLWYLTALYWHLWFVFNNLCLGNKIFLVLMVNDLVSLHYSWISATSYI